MREVDEPSGYQCNERQHFAIDIFVKQAKRFANAPRSQLALSTDMGKGANEPKPAAVLPGDRLHDFGTKVSERRQYRRVMLQFAVWWLKNAQADEAVAGIGIEISGGGLQFLLQEEIPERNCAIEFQLKGRRMRGNILTIVSAPVVYKEQPWQHYRAKFLGLRETDFDFIIGLTEQVSAAGIATTQLKNAIEPLKSYDMFPATVRENIVQQLVDMKRVARPEHVQLALLSAHYVGRQTLYDENAASFHRLSIRSKINSDDGPLVFDTLFFISEDGSKVFVRE